MMTFKTGKKWGIKFLLLFCTFLLTLGSVFAYSSLNNHMNAEEVSFDDSPRGEKIVDIAMGAESTAFYALTESGEIYAWGSNEYGQMGINDKNPVKVPAKVKNVTNLQSEHLYLSNIKKVFAGGMKMINSNSPDNSGGMVFAIDDAGALYAWGDNRRGLLGLPSKINYLTPTKVPLNVPVKHVAIAYNSVFVLTERGEIYVTFHYSSNIRSNPTGFGERTTDISTFTKVIKDANGKNLPPIKEVGLGSDTSFLLAEDGRIFGTGGKMAYHLGAGNISVDKAYYFNEGLNTDGTVITNAEHIVYTNSYQGMMLRLSDGKLLRSFGSASTYTYQPMEDWSLFRSSYPYFLNTETIEPLMMDSQVFIASENKIYGTNNMSSAWQRGNSVPSTSQYTEKDITYDYTNGRKVIGDSVTQLLLSNSGAVYLDGVKIGFGDFMIKAEKQANKQEFTSESLYNDNIDILVDIMNSSVNINTIRYDVIDLISNEKINTGESTNGTISVNLQENDRVYQKYEFYIDGKDNKEEFILDLYKKQPIISKLESTSVFGIGSSFAFSSNGFPENPLSATLSKDGGTAAGYTSGTPINDLGSYTLTLTDTYGNTNTYTFTIADLPSPESVLFTKSDAGEMIYDNAITKKDAILGSFSLQYAQGDTPSTIQTLTLLEENDHDKFEIIDTDQLKVKNVDLNAGTYTISVEGTDANNMPFAGTIEIVIAQAEQTMVFDEATKLLNTTGLAVGETKPLGVMNALGGVNVTYALRSENRCVSITGNTISATCVPDPATLSLTATPSGNANYTSEPVTLDITIIRSSIGLKIELLDSDDTYKDSVTINVGDALPAMRITTEDGIDVDTLGTPVYTYTKNGSAFANPSSEAGTYTVSAAYPAGSDAENYEITWTEATLIVNGITIDEDNQDDFFTMTVDGAPYIPGTWTNQEILITPVHPIFSKMEVDHAGNPSADAVSYNTEGDASVTLSFYNSDNVSVSTNVNIKYDITPPSITGFTYDSESALRTWLRSITFDHFFSEEKKLSFTGNDGTANAGSGLKQYRYEIAEIDEEGNEIAGKISSGTLGTTETLHLDINKRYRITGWAQDNAGNESVSKSERVTLSDEIAQLNITATSGGKAYDGNTWTSQPVIIQLAGTSSAGVEKYQYSADGVPFIDLASDTITLPDPLMDVNNVTYTFRSINQDNTTSDATLNLKVDTVRPIIQVKGEVDGTEYDGSVSEQNVTILPSQTNTSLSGITYYYTTDETKKQEDPTTSSAWKRYTGNLVHTTNGTVTYTFKAISGSGIQSDPVDLVVQVEKKVYNQVNAAMTSEGRNYTAGTWAKHDITFTLSGGMETQSQITGYEYTVTDGTRPSTTATWHTVSNGTKHIVTENVKNQTYWFRVVPNDPDGRISSGYQVKLDVDAPSVPTMTMEEINNSRMARFIHLFSFGNWMNKEARVMMTSTDPISGIDHYEYMEDTATKQSTTGILTYGDGTELSLKARACDKAGNCSSYNDSETIQIDMAAPRITGVKDQSEYKQYYIPRFFKVTDAGSGLAKAEYIYNNGAPTDFTTAATETKVKEEGTYQIKAKDQAGNELSITFKIVKLPNIETEIDGSDESKEIIDQIQKEYEEVKEKLDQTEKDDIDEWIKDAADQWEKSRNKVIEDDETTSKVEGQGDTTFDPNTELIVEEIPKEQVPTLPRNAIKTYDVYLKKGNTIIQPDGSIKVYLPYNASADPIVYEIDEEGNVEEISAVKEGDYVTFVTDKLMKYAISNTEQEENKKDICVVGPDGTQDTKDDVCGGGNEAGDSPIKRPDGSVEVPEGGKVIFPNGNELETPDGAIIQPDGTVELPNGDKYHPDGSKQEPSKPDEEKPDDPDETCPNKDELNVDTDNDGKPDINIDIDGDCEPDLNIDTDHDNIPNINIDTDLDGKPDYNIDNNDDGKPDVNIGPINDPWKPTVCKTVEHLEYCSDPYKKPYLNVDTDGDGRPDVSLDLDGDLEADLNIDVDGDGIPDVNIDSTGTEGGHEPDGKPDINIDTDDDGAADENLLKLTKWNPDKDVDGTIKYDTMSGLKPDPELNKKGDGSESISGQGDHNLPNTSVKGTYQGVGTGDITKASAWWILVLCNGCVTGYLVYRKRKQRYHSK